MFAPGEPADVTIRYLEGEKSKVHAELAVRYLEREAAVQDEIRALGQVDGARANQLRINRKIEEGLEAITSLQHEIAALIPKQQAPE